MALENLKRIIKIGEAFDKKSLNQDDFVKAFKSVVDVVVQIRKDVNEAIAKIGDTHNTLSERERTERDSNFNTLKSQVDNIFVGKRLDAMSGEQKALFEELKSSLNTFFDEKMGEVDERMSTVKSGDPGPPGDPGFGSPDTPDMILEKLTKVGLGLGRMKDLEELIKKVHNRLDKMPHAVQTPKYVNTPMVDVFTGDASTKAFTLSKAPKTLDTVKGWGSDFPFILVNGSDGGFTILGRTLTLNDIVDAPSSDARFVVEYYV